MLCVDEADTPRKACGKESQWRNHTKQQKPLPLNKSRDCSLKKVLKARQRVNDRVWLVLGSNHLSFGQLGLDVQIPTVAGFKHETFDKPVFVAIIVRISFGARQRDMGRL